jgi:hypothetical protein
MLISQLTSPYAKGGCNFLFLLNNHIIRIYFIHLAHFRSPPSFRQALGPKILPLFLLIPKHLADLMDSIYLWFYSPCGPWPPYQFLKISTVSMIPWTGDQPVAWPLLTRRTIQTQNKRTQTFMPWVGFEPTIPVSERAKKVHALVDTATVIGDLLDYLLYILL